MKELDESLPATFTTETSRARGVNPRDLYAWRDGGQIIELSRGVFRRADAPPASYPDMIAVAHRAPRAIVCCVAAPAIHELTADLGKLHRTGSVCPRAFHEDARPQTECSCFQAARSMWPMGTASCDEARRAIPTLRRSWSGAA